LGEKSVIELPVPLAWLVDSPAPGDWRDLTVDRGALPSAGAHLRARGREGQLLAHDGDEFDWLIGLSYQLRDDRGWLMLAHHRSC
jgi:hypothetical protein